MDPTPSPRRKNIRLKDFDYRSPGSYFVTICTAGKRCTLAQVREGVAGLSESGCEVVRVWEGLPRRFPRVELGAFVVMPNHVHGIIILKIVDSDDVLRPETSLDTSLFSVVGLLKSDSAKAIHRIVSESGRPVWQRRFFDRILRDEKEYVAATDYILNNPREWESDRENPERTGN